MTTQDRDLRRAIRNGHPSTEAVRLRRLFGRWCASRGIDQAPGVFRYWLGVHHPLHYDEAHDLWQASEVPPNLRRQKARRQAGGGA